MCFPFLQALTNLPFKVLASVALLIVHAMCCFPTAPIMLGSYYAMLFMLMSLLVLTGMLSMLV
jgi:hypothetical protein